MEYTPRHICRTIKESTTWPQPVWNGELVSIIFARDTLYSIGIMAPIELVVKDMERMLELPENTIGL